MRRLFLAGGLAALILILTVVAVDSATAVTPTSPIAVTGSASAITMTTATLAATVDPVGQATTYTFDYGTTTAYGKNAPAPAASAGMGVVAIPVTGSLTGLLPGTTYHFRVSATNLSGTTLGLDQSFTTADPPVVSTGAATALAATSATLTGTVNPSGAATTYAFQYGPTTGYGQQTPTQSAGAGTAGVPVSATVGGLTVATTYHYRLTATNASGAVPGADETFVTAGTPPPSTLAVGVRPAGGDTDLQLSLGIGTDPAGTPSGQALSIGDALSSQFVSQLSAFGICSSAAFDNLQGPTAANCPDRSAIVGSGTLVTRGPTGTDTTSDQGFLVKTAGNQITFWWHTPAVGTGGAQGFGQVAGAVSQETGTYGPVVTYDFSGLPAGSRVKRLNVDYQRNGVTGKAPFAATACVGTSQVFQARIVYLGGPASELPTAAVICPLPPAPQPSKLQLARATITGQVIDILAPISRRASGVVSLELYAAGQHSRWTAAINSVDGRIRDTHVLPASQANNGGTGILTIRYAGNAVTRPQVVRLRAGNVPAVLDAGRPTLVAGHLHAQGTISSQAHGVVRVQLEYYSGGQTTTLERYASISGGAWNLDTALTAAQQAAVAARRGTVESYILFTGYFRLRMRGEMIAYQVLGSQ